MGISLKPEHLQRYKDIARLFIKYGRGDLVKDSGIEVVGDEEVRTTEPGGDPRAEEFAADLEKLGPTFIKLGQLLSTRAELIPMSYLESLSRLQDNVEPFPYEEVEKIVSSELGVRISKAFSEFDVEPLAAASIGQVHTAKLRDGRPVVVKVQRPNIREQVAKDLEALEDVAEFLDSRTAAGEKYNFTKILADFRKSLIKELDYNTEAQNLVAMRRHLKDFERIVVPEPILDYTTSRVLTMERVRGTKITSLTPLTRMELDGGVLAEELFRAYLEQVLVNGFFHADPHPGNVFLTEDKKIALLDLGMVARISPRLQEHLLKLLLAISEGRGDEAADICELIGEPKLFFDRGEFERRITSLVAENQGASMEKIQVGRLILKITNISGETGIRVPQEMTMLGKTLLNLDEVGRALDPSFDPNASVRRNSTELMNQRIKKSLSPGNFFTSMLELKEMAEKMPARINQVLDLAANNELKVKVNAFDEVYLMEAFQKLANRITTGVILSGAIVGASMLARVETAHRTFGYPTLAIVLFLAAVIGSGVLLFNIFFSDEPIEKKSATRRK
jgi:ubiquinone biosynthesis protein